jgi:hypothetical protein
MKRVLPLLILVAAVVLVAGQASYAQEPLAFYGHLPPLGAELFYPVYQGPYYAYNIGGGVYLVEPFFPPGYVLSQPGVGFPPPVEYVGVGTRIFRASRAYARGYYGAGGYGGMLP